MYKYIIIIASHRLEDWSWCPHSEQRDSSLSYSRLSRTTWWRILLFDSIFPSHFILTGHIPSFCLPIIWILFIIPQINSQWNFWQFLEGRHPRTLNFPTPTKYSLAGIYGWRCRRQSRSCGRRRQLSGRAAKARRLFCLGQWDLNLDRPFWFGTRIA